MFSSYLVLGQNHQNLNRGKMLVRKKEEREKMSEKVFQFRALMSCKMKKISQMEIE